MSQHEIDVADMQCWVFRLAQKRWMRPANECLRLFQRYDVFGYISDLYDLLHLSSYAAALDDVETMMRSQGATI